MNEQIRTLNWARAPLMVSAVGLFLIGISASDLAPTKLVWNASRSIPIGLYAIRKRTPERGDLVLVRVPDWAELIANQRGYLPSHLPAIKRVSALGGDNVCRMGRTILVNGKAVARARSSDGCALKLPIWNGCVALDESQVFLLADHPKSFDGRYFGVTKLTDVLGVAKPIWIR